MSFTNSSSSYVTRLGAVLVAFSVAACGDDGRPSPDGGTDMMSGDTIAPTVRNTTPAEGDTGVNRREPFIVRFSEPMNTASGAISAEPGGPIPAARWSWDDVGSTLTITPNSPWAPGAVTLTIADFEDPAGNVLVEPLEVTFETVDDVRPFLTATTPMEGATDVSARLPEITLTFSEEMNTTSGVIDVLGGAATVGAPEWNAEGTVVTFPVADLEYERDYDVDLRNFRDAIGNPLDDAPIIEDGFLDFSTGADTDAPQVVRSEPMEGQVDVNAATQRQIEIVFDEPMATSTTTFVLNDGTDDIMVNGSWAGGATLLRLDTDGILEFETSYSIDLSALTDRAGNALDGTAYLVDGSLDFTVSDDVFDPVVLSTDPAEGDTGIDQKEELSIEVVFSEAMDQTLTTATLTDGTTPVTIDGTWATSTIINFTVPVDTMAASTEYMLDLTPFMDLTGNTTSTTHGYLMDGMLNFTTGNPSGENCLDALTPANATVASGVTTWTISSSQVSSREGGTDACADYTGTATRPDVVIRYDKVSGDVASGGRLLRVVADADTTFTEYDIAITAGACDPAAAPARCVNESEIHQVYADVPAGPVHIWISPNSSSSFSNSMVVTVEEVDPPRAEGEGCDNPYTTASSIFSTVGSTDTFLIPEGMGPRAMDISAYSVGDNSLVSCDTTSTSSTSATNGTGVDAVIRYTMPADAVLRVTAEGLDSSLNPEFNVSAYDTCDPALATAEYGCIPDVSTTAKNGIIDAPPGDIYIWLTNETSDIYRSSSSGDYYFHEAQIDIETIPVQAGETCSRAFAATAGSNTVTGTADVGVVVPSCFASTSNVEWYSYTTTQPLFVAGTVGAGGVSVYQGGTELGCSADGSAVGASTLVPAGTELCVAVEMGQGITDLTITETAYTGLGLNPPVSLPIERPINTSGSTETITGDTWMSGNGSVIVMAYGSEMLDALADGTGSTLYRGTADGITSSVMGNAGLFAANGALFSFDDTTSGANRMYRLWDGSAPFYDPIVWDTTPPTYPSEEITAATVVGNTIYFVTGDDYPIFYSMSATAPGAPVRMGTNEIVTDVTGLAADDTYFYVAGEYKADFDEGVFRIPFTELGNPMYDPLNLTPDIDHDGTQFASNEIAMYVDATTAPGHLYIRNAIGHFEAVIDPGGASPIYVGEVISVGGSGDNAAWLDLATGSLYIFETDSESTGSFLRYDP